MKVDIDNTPAIIAALTEISEALTRPKSLSVRRREQYGLYLRELTTALQDEEAAMADLQAELDKMARTEVGEAMDDAPPL